MVAEARDGPEAVDLIVKHQPDVALVDMTMPGLNGLAVVGRARVDAPSVHVLVISMHDNEEYVWEALTAGASGYLLKDASATGAGARRARCRRRRRIPVAGRVASRRA